MSPLAQQMRTKLAFAAVTTLFLAWGFITSLVDPLVAAVKGIFTLTDFQAQTSAFAFFLAYLLVSIPAAALVGRFKPVPSIIFALCMMIMGCLLMLVAANSANYWFVLLGLFVLASGITVLQVAANPLAAALGDPRFSHFRLTLSQTFNSFGTFMGPLLGAHLFLNGLEVKQGTVVTDVARAEALAGIDSAYFWICGLIAALALFFWFSRHVVGRAAPLVNSNSGLLSAFRCKWALLGSLAIFVYVGAEVSIGTQMAFFLNDNSIWGQSDVPFSVPLLGYLMGSDAVPGVSLQEAGKAVSFYWGGAMIGRAVGSLLLTKVQAHRLLATFAMIAAFSCFYVFMVGGVSAGFAALGIGLFNSIMFPVIFTLTLERSSASAESTSGLLCTAISGGAVIPLIVGIVSGMHGYGFALIVPGLCYIAVILFAVIAGLKPVSHKTVETASLH